MRTARKMSWSAPSQMPLSSDCPSFVRSSLCRDATLSSDVCCVLQTPSSSRSLLRALLQPPCPNAPWQPHRPPPLLPRSPCRLLLSHLRPTQQRPQQHPASDRSTFTRDQIRPQRKWLKESPPGLRLPPRSIDCIGTSWSRFSASCRSNCCAARSVFRRNGMLRCVR